MSKSGSFDETRRLALLKRLGEQLGEEEAETLMESLPPVPWDRLATKDDLKALEERLLHEVNKLRVEMFGESGRVDSRFEKVESRFDMVDSRFEKVESRFDMVDSRFEKVESRFDMVDSRFEKVESRFDMVDSRFEKVESRFDMVDSRFEKVESRFDMVDSRFEKVESRFEKVEAEMKAMEGRLTLQMSNLARTVIFAIIGFSLATILSVVGMGLAIALT